MVIQGTKDLLIDMELLERLLADLEKEKANSVQKSVQKSGQ